MPHRRTAHTDTFFYLKALPLSGTTAEHSNKSYADYGFPAPEDAVRGQLPGLLTRLGVPGLRARTYGLPQPTRPPARSIPANTGCITIPALRRRNARSFRPVQPNLTSPIISHTARPPCSRPRQHGSARFRYGNSFRDVPDHGQTQPIDRQAPERCSQCSTGFAARTAFKEAIAGPCFRQQCPRTRSRQASPADDGAVTPGEPICCPQNHADEVCCGLVASDSFRFVTPRRANRRTNNGTKAYRSSFPRRISYAAFCRASLLCRCPAVWTERQRHPA